MFLSIWVWGIHLAIMNYLSEKKRLKESIGTEGMEGRENMEEDGGSFFFLRSLINIDCLWN